jgi:DNA-binding IclR family transcriptional regulator
MRNHAITLDVATDSAARGGRRRGPADADRRFVTALARGIEVLRCFTPGEPWLAPQEIARRTGLAKPTAARLLHTLARLGYLRHSPQLNQYALGYGAVAVGFAALGQMDVRRIARPFMQALSEQTHTAVNLAVRDGAAMLLVDMYRPTSAFVVNLGSRLPIATTSLGRAYLAALSATERAAVLEELRSAHGEGWAGDGRALESAVAEYEAHGYCLGLGEWRREVHAVSVPLALPGDGGVAVFSCSGAAFQLAPEVLRGECAPRLLTLVGNVRMALLHLG